MRQWSYRSDEASRQRRQPPWCDPFILSFEAYRRLLLLRLRWHAKSAATPRPGRQRWRWSGMNVGVDADPDRSGVVDAGPISRDAGVAVGDLASGRGVVGVVVQGADHHAVVGQSVGHGTATVGADGV